MSYFGRGCDQVHPNIFESTILARGELVSAWCRMRSHHFFRQRDESTLSPYVRIIGLADTDKRTLAKNVDSTGAFQKKVDFHGLRLSPDNAFVLR